MRLQSLVLENFGVHASRRIEFGPGLQVVYGPNESGKTTLLAALRQTLFGIPFDSHFGGDVTGTRTKARVELANGTNITITRKRARNQEGIGGEIETTREPLTRELWERALGGASQSLFENLFAFSLGELASGERSLLEAGLTEALYGMAVGGLKRFRSLATQLDERAEELFTRRGRSKRANLLLNELLGVRKEYEQARFTGTDYTNLEVEIREIEEAAERHRSLENEARRALRALERIEAALPAWREADTLRAELAAIGSGANLPPALAQSVAALLARQGEIATELQQHHARVATSAIAMEIPGGRLVPWSVAIRGLADQVGQVREALSEQHRLEQEFQGLEQRIAAAITEIHSDWSTADLPRVVTSLANGELTRELESQWSQLEQTLAGLKSRRQDLDEQRDRVELRLRELPDTDRLPGVRELVSRAEQYRQEARPRTEARAALDTLDRQCTQLGQQLAGQLGIAVEHLGELVVPLTATIDQFAAEWETLAREKATTDHGLRAVEKRFRSAREELAVFDRENPGGDREELLALRRHREDGWLLVIAACIEKQLPADAPAVVAWTGGRPGQLIELYRDAVVRADLASDRLLADAERTARRQQLVIALEQIEGQKAEAQDAVTAIESQIGQLSARWAAEWSFGAPRSPREMAEWVKEFARWQDLGRRQTTLHAEVGRYQESAAEFESELLRAFPGTMVTDRAIEVRDALTRLQAHEQALLKAQQERERGGAERRELQIKREALERAEFDAALQQGDLEIRRAELLAGLGLPGDWSMGVVSRVVSFSKETQSLDRERTAATQRMERLQRVIDEFQVAAETLCRDIGESVVAVPQLCDRVLEWRGELDQRHRRELEQKTLLAEQSSSEQMTQRLREQHENIVREIETLRRQAGLPEGTDWPSLLREAGLAESLRAQLREVTPRWQAHADGDPGFADKLRGATLEQLIAERQRLTETARVEESARSREMAQADSLRMRLSARSEETRALALAQRLEFVRSQMVDLVDEWSPLIIARHLMDEALQRFEKTQQPQLLLEAGRLFEQLTLGEYVQLTRAVGETNTLHAIPRQGPQKTPAELSTGTREQLYLAIRLAYLRQYSAKAEPLPLVMDDVLVNFDEDRAKQTLAVLRDFGRDYQILFLTCHRHVVDLARQVDGELQPIELRAGTLVRPEPTAPGEIPETRRTTRPRSRKPDEAAQPLLFRDSPDT